ncbi:MAG: T9SS type A sorting domain-containing protein [Bacteroidota bacterium]
MKKLFTLFVLLICFSGLKAQFVTIPDANFVTWLQTNVPSAMNGTQMDTTSSVVVNRTSILINDFQIWDLTGIQYFDSLKSLDCSNYIVNGGVANQISTLPRLPSTIDTLLCRGNLLTTLPKLPSSFRVLDCAENQFMCLPFLPNSINLMNISNNPIQCVTNYISAMDSTSLAYPICTTGNSCSITTNPNYVTIPDPNFVAWLQTNVPSAMNGNQMDTTSLAVTTRTAVNVQPVQFQTNSINSLTGIHYFKSLKFLNCSGNIGLNNLPQLPITLDSLFCSGTYISYINWLPPNLKKLIAGGNNLVSLPALPSTLTFLSVYSPSLTGLPALPSGLVYLACSSSPGYISHTLPTLPNTLKYLYCSLFHLDSLPTLPNSLIALDCQMNGITQLPSLPINLKRLNCSYLQINSIPNLPTSLISLDCIGNNGLTTLPFMPAGLKVVRSYNCSNLHAIPLLPDSLEILDCRNDSLNYLPILPNMLKELRASNNQISCIPSLPTTLTYIDIANNLFTCLPNYLQIMDPSYFTYPLCTSGNTLTNPNGCERASGIIGNAYFDTNTNCIKDTNDTKLNNINFKLYDNNNQYLNQASSHSLGMYNFVYPVGNYKVVLETSNTPYTAQCNYPGVDTTIQLSAASPNADKVNFSVKCKPGFDVGVQSVLTSGLVFPGQSHHLKIIAGDMSQWYCLNCASGISGELIINVSGPVTYVAPSGGSLTPIVAGNSFTYTISDFGTIINLNDFELIMKTDTTATIGDSICVRISVTPITGDSYSSNNSYNFCYNVSNSFDPNVKEVYPVDLQAGFNDWLTYTIHFQNTGNAPALNIRLRDSLDNNLDIESFKVINYSHSNTWSINNKNLFFNFQNIQLPDSASDPEGSKGYVQYKIKPKINLGPGTKIKNTAYIYFDYNSPIVTNTTINEYMQVVSVKENFKEFNIIIYPNPSHDTFTIELDSKEKHLLQVFDMNGSVVLSQSFENGKTTIDASNLPGGIYSLSIKGNETVINKKMIIVK